MLVLVSVILFSHSTLLVTLAPGAPSVGSICLAGLEHGQSAGTVDCFYVTDMRQLAEDLGLCSERCFASKEYPGKDNL